MLIVKVKEGTCEVSWQSESSDTFTVRRPLSSAGLAQSLMSTLVYQLIFPPEEPSH